MNTKYHFIFDLDGTLYQFDRGQAKNFAVSQFAADIQENIYRFLMSKCRLSRIAAEQEYQRLKVQYKDGVSLALEQEYGLDRYDYFEQTWRIEPRRYVNPNPMLVSYLKPFVGRSALLTAAPAVWARSVLGWLGIASIFGQFVFTGEPDVRKPNPAVFRQVAAALAVNPETVISIGDQEHTDIVPAQNLGMKTLLIGEPQNTKPDYVATDINQAIILLQKKGLL